MKKFIRSYHSGRVSFWETFREEWKTIRADKAVVASFVSLTLVLIVLYSLVYGKEVVIDVPVAVVDQDFSKTGRDYINILDVNRTTAVYKGYTDLEDAKADFYEKKVKGVVIVPKDFEKDLRTNRQPAISVYADASNMIFYRAVYGSVVTTNSYFNGGIKVRRAIASGESVNSTNPISTISYGLFNPSRGYGTYLVPMVTSLMLQLVIMMAIGILGGTRIEANKTITYGSVTSKQGIIPQLLGKASLYFCISMVVLLIQLGLLYNLFSFPLRASILSLYGFFVPYIFAIVFFAICITSLFKKREDAILFLALLTIPALMLSGLSFPTESFSFFYSTFAQLIPSTAGTRGFVKLTQMQAGFDEVLNEWVILWALVIFYFFLASLSLRYGIRKVKTNAQT